MYIVTFYSFKGGVGRSMSLANVATELVKRGRKVLMVDFDLEAPGLHTFDFGCNKDTTGGIVDYVEEYLDSASSPDVNNHIVKCDMKDAAGELWLMPAGSNNENYSQRLSSINWQDLYENKSGFLLFEDMKAQWQDSIAPDYVLIDSRTGHTDVSGICTRQLPNAVVFLFFPNEQNLSGLTRVVSAVDEQNEKLSDDTQIEKHFVTSNVPDLDDEDQILADRLISFSKNLNYKKLTATIHRYNSLALLNQEIFTLNRPNTRLAQEYRHLVNEISLKNPEDIDGSITFLNTLSDETIRENSESSINQVTRIQEKHKRNPIILEQISIIKERLGDYNESLSLITKAIEYGNNEPRTLLRKARLLIGSDKKDEALTDIREILQLPNIGYELLRLTINLLYKTSPNNINLVLNSPSLYKLDEFPFSNLVQSYFLYNKTQLTIAENALIQYIKMNNTSDSNEFNLIYGTLGRICIAEGRFSEAKAHFSPEYPNEESLISEVFNYAMAEWGETGTIPVELFRLVIKKSFDFNFSDQNANYKQCISLAYCAIGELDSAFEWINRASQDARETLGSLQSCWSYLEVSKREFLSDIKEMIELYNGKEISPKFCEPTLLPLN